MRDTQKRASSFFWRRSPLTSSSGGGHFIRARKVTALRCLCTGMTQILSGTYFLSCVLFASRRATGILPIEEERMAQIMFAPFGVLIMHVAFRVSTRASPIPGGSTLTSCLVASLQLRRSARRQHTMHAWFLQKYAFERCWSHSDSRQGARRTLAV